MSCRHPRPAGLLLPRDSSCLNPALANNLPLAGDSAKVTSILTADGWSKVSGKWTKGGKTISFSISDPINYTDYYLDAQAIAKQLNALGIHRHRQRHRQPDRLAGDVTNGNFDTAIHWSNQGPTPYQIYDGNLDANLTAPVGKPAASNIGRWDSAATQAALAQFAGSNDLSVQKSAITKPGEHHDHSGSGRPAAVRRGVVAVLHPDYTGFPSSSNPFINPSTNSPYLEETVLHLKPVS